ncbi:hypothetical protein D3C73_1329560 [compost metagenome]
MVTFAKEVVHICQFKCLFHSNKEVWPITHHIAHHHSMHGNIAQSAILVVFYICCKQRTTLHISSVIYLRIAQYEKCMR